MIVYNKKLQDELWNSLSTELQKQILQEYENNNEIMRKDPELAGEIAYQHNQVFEQKYGKHNLANQTEDECDVAIPIGVTQIQSVEVNKNVLTIKYVAGDKPIKLKFEEVR